MKKILLLIFFFLTSQLSYCDIAPDNSHLVEKCVKITNVTNFSDYYILGLIEGPMAQNKLPFIIDATTCIDQGYKFNRVKILALKKSYLGTKKLESIDWEKDPNVLKCDVPIYCDGGYMSNDNPTSSIEEYYKIAALIDHKILLYKARELVKFSDGRPILLKMYSFNGANPKNNPKIIIDENSSIIEIYPSSEIIIFLKALLFTILTETFVLFLLFKIKYKGLNIKSGLLLFTGIIASFSTLPYVWFVFPIFIKSAIIYILISELLVVVIESFIIFKLLKIDYKKALLASLLCNLCSFLIGLLLNWIHLL